MTIDFQAVARSTKQQVEPPWDDLRAARTQKKVLDALRSGAQDGASDPEGLDEPTDELQSKRAESQRRRVYVIAVAALAVAAACLLWLRAPGVVSEASWATAELNYKDGSRSMLGKQARVQVVEESDSRVEVEQRSGKVRYEIEPNAKRRFHVRTRGVSITVLGTVFDVQVDEHLVTVSVERGKVQVDHGGEQVILTRGRRLAVSVPAAKSGPVGDEPTSEAKRDTPQLRTADTEPSRQTEQSEASSAGSTPAVRPVIPTGAGGGREAGPTADDLIRRADRARGSGNHHTASKALLQLLRDHPRDRRATLARFNLAQVRRAQGQHASAAQLFEQCGRALRGDAIAEAASSWLRAGQTGRARAAAMRYLDAFPGGVHAGSMRKLSGRK